MLSYFVSNTYKSNSNSNSTTKIIILFVGLVLLSACASSSLKIVNTLAKNKGYTLVSDIAYGTHSLNKLDLYLPKHHSNKAKATVIFFYGGCWGYCLKFRKESYLFIGQALANKGHIVAVVNYRTYPQVKFHTLIRDAAKSIEWVKQNISRYSGNPNSIFLMGHSAGGHMAATLAYDRQYLKPTTWKSIKGMIGLAGAYDFHPFKQDYQFKIFSPKSNYRNSQPIRFITGKEAPSLLLYGSKDQVVQPRNINKLSKVIRKKNGIVETHFYKRISHAGLVASLSRPFQRSRPVLNDIHHFIQKYISR
ncbi:hypothetical protein MNBD_GAMMA12-3703 [hydrothermal vent metagenome]|uniref:BD-FAE-like domain-containing protein n=1 Tax=hydrothermal vent metagenome TaxID=652676 RepID=A0A3B0YI22_9ZZZZ